MISDDLIYSRRESGNSLESASRRVASVTGMIDYDDDGPSLRIIAKDTSREMDETATEGEGPEGFFDLKKKIHEWREHTREFATGAGFRKAHKGRGPIDARRFALQLSQYARDQADRSGSQALLNLSRRLRWVANQGSVQAVRALERLADTEPEFGKSRIEKPREMTPAQSPAPLTPTPKPTQGPTQGQAPAITPQVPQGQPLAPFNPANSPLYPHTAPAEPSPYVAPRSPGSGYHPQDRSWESERASSRHAFYDDDEGESGPVDADLVQHARNFIDRYISTNSLGEDPDIDNRLSDPDVFESWVVDLDNKGVLADPEDLDHFWNQAMGDITGEEEAPRDDLESIHSSRDELGPSKDPFTAPGGDWANTIIPTDENPQLDRYLRRSGTRRAMKVSAVTEAADQLMDHVSGEMVPSEISADHVKQFVNSEYPDVPWKDVMAVISKIADPNRRHEKEEKDRDEKESSRKPASRRIIQKRITGSLVSPVDNLTRSSVSRSLRSCKEICSCCHGTGEGDLGTCTSCSGKGQTHVNPDGGDLEHKHQILQKVGSLLLVAVPTQRVPGQARREFSRLTGARTAGTGVSYHTHSCELMKLLRDYQIPYRTASYRHPIY